MNDIHIKPIVDARYDDDLCCDWLFYKSGEYSTPLFITNSGTMRNLVQEYCDFHKLELKKKDWVL